jgi:CubicO group peptidase (beta-lactamase class C family)
VGTGGAALPETDDPGTGPFEPVPAQEVEGECGLDPALLAQIDQRLNLRWGIVRYGKLCHEFYPGQDSPDSVDHVFSATKTFAAMVFGRLVYETRDLEVKGPRTGPIDPFQRVDQWIDLSGSRYDIHRDATIAHVLAMVAYSDDLSFGQKAHSYDTDGTREINALSDILNAAIRQDPERLGSDLEEFTQRYVYAPLGMTHSTWNDGAPDKIFAYSWNANIRDMLRVGLLINNGGVWNDERLVSARYLYDMIHPAFEDGNTGYGYLTWLNGKNHRPPLVGQLIKSPTPTDGCAPLAIHKTYPHGISESPDCGYDGAPQSCAQEHDVGAWSAQGLNGNYIYGHRGLDLVIAIQNYGTLNGVDALWNAVRPALVAVDPTYEGDDAAFCADYGRNAYAPDLALWEGGL